MNTIHKERAQKEEEAVNGSVVNIKGTHMLIYSEHFKFSISFPFNIDLIDIKVENFSFVLHLYWLIIESI